MVVLMNFLHVMTILPSAILVNEFYVAPLQQRLLKWFKTSFRKNDLKARDVIHESDGGNSHFGTNEGSSLENTSQMNRMDRWLVTKYAPFINRRAVIAVVLTFSLAAILGSLGVAKFAMSDGNIVLFTDKYNLGRLTIVTDTYFNKDIKKTIEENRETSTKPPESTPNSGGQGSSSGVTLPESTTQGGPLGNENSGANAAEGSNDGSTSESATSPSTGSTSSGNSVTGGVPSVPAPQPAPQQDFDEAITTAPVSAAPLGPNSGLDLRRRETIFVNLIWGVDADEQGSQLWKVRRNNNNFAKFGDDNIRSSSFDPSVPTNQEALLKTIQMARMDKALNVQPDKITWIEMLRDFTVDIGIGFPLPKELFIGYIEILKQRDTKFADLVSRELGTQSPGLAGDFTYTSITLEVDAVQNESLSLSESVYRQWNAFATEVNANSPTDVPDMVAQSRIFLDAYRVETTVESTVATWFIANGLCLLVILLFTRNLALSLMVMGTISLIFLCLGGIIFSMFKIPFGAVEALGISIFIGLSANYSLHVVHAYHHAKGDTRAAKVAEAIFAVGGPIVASALSTIGASAFLFGCRTWVFVELGILVCSITTMALLYSMTFLLAWLTLAGPRPFERNGKQVHAWDIHALCCSKIWCHSTADACENVCQADDELDGECSFRYPKSSSRIDTIDSDNRSSNDSSEEIQDRGDDSDYSIEVVDDLCGATMDIHEQNSDDHSIMVVDE
jgi:MMPL family